MAETIDTRIVEMRFDNHLFEGNIQTTIDSLNSLKESLDLDDSSKELERFLSNGNSAMSHIGATLDEIAGKFSFMGSFVQRIFGRIQNGIINFGHTLKSEFSSYFGMTAIKSGMQEYETQINSVQTILANTSDALRKEGLSDEERLERVNSKLRELNTYADKTIYNFTEMTNNIGRFTAAGVELDTAVSSIQGIANLAAVSGSTSQQASNAMYQLSQALSTGALKLQDWNSVVNAGMGGELFQKALIRTAKAMDKKVDVQITEIDKKGKKVKKTVKKNVDELIEYAGSFRDSLKYGWIDDKVLSTTLEQLSWDFESLAKAEGKTVQQMKDAKKAELISAGYSAEDADAIIALAEEATEAATKVKTLSQLLDTLKEAAQSGWTQTWELIIGDFEEAKQLFTGLSNFFGKIIGDSADSRNEIIKQWKDLGGRNTLFGIPVDINGKVNENGDFGALWNILYGLRNIIQTIKDEFANFFPKKTGKDLYDITKSFQDLTKRFYEFTKNKNTIKAIRTTVKVVALTIKALMFVAQSVYESVKNRITGVIEFFGRLFDFFKNPEKNISSFWEFIKGELARSWNVVSEWVQNLPNLLALAWTAIKDSGLFGEYAEVIEERAIAIWDAIKGAYNTVVSGIQYYWGIISTKLQETWAWISEFFAPLAPYFESVATTLRTWYDLIISMLFGGGSEDVNNDTKSGAKTIKQATRGITDSAKELNRFSFAGVWMSVVDTFSKFAVRAGKIWESVKGVFANVVSAISGWWPIISKWFSDSWTKIQTWIQKVKDSGVINEWWEKLKVGLSAAVTKVKQFGTAVVKAFGKVKEYLRSDNNIFTRMWNGLKGLVEKVPEAKKRIQEFFGSIGSAIQRWFPKISEWFGGISKSLKEFWNGLTGGNKTESAVADAGEVIEEQLNPFQSIWKWLSNVGTSISNWWQGLWGFVQAGWTSLQMVLKPFFSETVPKGISAAMEWLKSIDWDTIIKTVWGAHKFVTILSLVRSVHNFSKGFKDIGSTFSGISKSISTITDKIRNIGQKDFTSIVDKFINGNKEIDVKKTKEKVDTLGTTLLKIAGSIALIVASLYVLSKIDDKSLQKGLLVIGGITAAMIVLALILNKVKVDGKVFINVGLGIMMLGLTIWGLSRLSWQDIGKGLIGIGALLLELAIFTKIATEKKIKGLISLSVAVLILSISLKRIAKMSWKQILKGIVGIGLILLEIALFTKIASKNKKQMAGTIALAASVWILVSQLQRIAKLTWGELLKGLVGLGLIFAELAVYTKIASKNKKQMAGTIALALSMWILVGVVKRLADMDYEALTKGLIAMGVMLLEVSVATGRMRGSGSIMSTIATLGLLVGAIYVFIKAFDYLKESGADSQQYEDMKNFAEGTSILIVGIAKAMDLISRIKFGAGLQGIATFGVMLGALAAIIVALGALREALGAEGVDAFLESGAEFMESIGQSIGKFINGLIEGIFGLENFSLDFDFSLPALGTDLTTFMTNAKGFIEGLTDIPEGAVAGAGRLAGVMLAIGGAEFIAALGAFVTNRESLFSSVKEDMGMIADGVTNFATKVKGFSRLATQDDLDRSVETAKSLAAVMKALPWSGGMMQDLFGSPDLPMFAANVPLLGTGLSLYALGVRGYTKKANSDDLDKSVEIAAALAGVYNSLPNTGGWMGDLFGQKDIQKFSENMPYLGKGLMEYASSVKGISYKASGADVARAQSSANAIKDLYNALPWTDGALQGFLGAPNLDKFATTIPELGNGLVTFAQSINGIDNLCTDEDRTFAIDTATNIKDIFKALPLTDGAWQEAFGGQNLSTFSTGIVDLGWALRQYALSVAGFSTGKLNNVDKTLKGVQMVGDSEQEMVDVAMLTEQDVKMVNLALSGIGDLSESLKTIETSDLFKSTRVESFQSFGTGVKYLTEGIKNYADAVPGIAQNRLTEEDIDIVNTVLEGFVGVDQRLPKKEWNSEGWTKVEDMATFGSGVKLLAEALGTYILNVGGLAKSGSLTDEDNEAAIKALEGFVKLDEELPTKEFSSFWSTESKEGMDTFGTGVKELSEGLGIFVTNISGLKANLKDEDINAAVTIAQKLAEVDAALPDRASVVGTLLFGGRETLKSFAAQLGDLGTGLATFAVNLGDADMDQADRAAVVIDKIVEVFKKLDTGSPLEKILSTMVGWDVNTQTPIKRLKSYMASMNDVANDLRTFVTTITGETTTISETGEELSTGGVDLDVAGQSLDLVDQVVTIMNKLGSEYSPGSFMATLKYFFGGEQSKDKTLIDYTASLATVGANLKLFADNLTGGDYTNAQEAVDLTEQIVEIMAGKLGDDGTFVTDMSVVANDMGVFGDNFGRFVTGMTNAKEALTNWQFAMKVITSYVDFLAKVHNGELLFSDDFSVWDLDQWSQILSGPFATIVNSFSIAIQNGEPNVKISAQHLVIAGHNAMTTKAMWNLWRLAGKYLASGLAQGIVDGEPLVTTAASSVATYMRETVQTSLEEHSPSRVGARIGMYFDLGIAEGLRGYTKVVTDSASDVSNGVVDSVRGMLTGPETSIFDNLDPNPAIRPVLDLSNVRSGFGTIDGMFRSERTLGEGMFQDLNFMNSAGELNFDGARIVGGLSNTDVVTELQELENGLAELGEQVGNMQLVLDTGALVGGTSAKMDSQLGTLAMRRGRGN